MKRLWSLLFIFFVITNGYCEEVKKAKENIELADSVEIIDSRENELDPPTKTHEEKGNDSYFNHRCTLKT